MAHIAVSISGLAASGCSQVARRDIPPELFGLRIAAGRIAQLDAKPAAHQQRLLGGGQVQDRRDGKAEVLKFVPTQRERSAGDQQPVALLDPAAHGVAETAQEKQPGIPVAGPVCIAHGHFVDAVEQEQDATRVDEGVEIDPACGLGPRPKPLDQRSGQLPRREAVPGRSSGKGVPELS